MNKKLYVGNLSFNATKEDIQNYFESQGQVENVNLITDRDTGRLKGFGFVEMASAQAATDAVNALNGQEFMGRNIKVDIAADKNDSRSRRY